MEQEYLSEDIIEQIKDFPFYFQHFTKEQKLLIDKLIINEELKSRYKNYGLCIECRQPNTGSNWCQSCNAKHFQQDFKNWTSGNPDVDKLIQESQLNAKSEDEKLIWIEYDRFENIKYIAKGGFGTISKAICKEGIIANWNYETNQWNKYSDFTVALKHLNNSKDITLEFLNEIIPHLRMNKYEHTIKLYGITKDLNTNDFIMVIEYANEGSLRQMLDKLSYGELYILSEIASGLNDIHKEGLIHQDFHSGNILYSFVNPADFVFIADLGLCRPANEKSVQHNKNVYGVLPYVAPEVLRGKEYTQASDIYSFGIIINEVFNGIPPYHDMAHDEFLAIRICQGFRPGFTIKVPQLIEDIFKQCVDANPLKRPTAEYLKVLFSKWNYAADSETEKQFSEAAKFNKEQPSSTNNSTELTYTTHPQAIYTSRLLKFNNLPEPTNADNTDNDCLEEDYSESTKIDFTKLNISNSQDNI
ncbi:hypothetical protein RclHR1_09490001 [Rhizophagus clarus]|uniref:Kinase-like domain-containing protein n=1 Tax=Rhizophagus clarus TaxID=94130 RepID=A0A2Z6SHR8_9GLOM|nr:hypothetical protein RclHR1_09490001 [Rhizophagus clarus]GES93909.1 kinase-like domain-containing protein [Rhizophagus clarus]